jgi:hypothetical protein
MTKTYLKIALNRLEGNTYQSVEEIEKSIRVDCITDITENDQYYLLLGKVCGGEGCYKFAISYLIDLLDKIVVVKTEIEG